jgi:hypothetical protein
MTMPTPTPMPLIMFLITQAEKMMPAKAWKAFFFTLMGGGVVFHIMWACGWLTTLGFSGFAQASEVRDAKRELVAKIERVDQRMTLFEAEATRLGRVQRRGQLESELRRLDQDIFSIEARVKELTRANVRVDRIYDERLAELKRDKEGALRRLDAFLRANPEIAE